MAEQIIAQIKEVYKQKGPKFAFKLVDKALRNHPASVDLLLLKAEMWEEFGKTNRALEIIRKAEEIDPGNVRISSYKKKIDPASKSTPQSEILPSQVEAEKIEVSILIVNRSPRYTYQLDESLIDDLLQQTVRPRIELLVCDRSKSPSDSDDLRALTDRYKSQVRYLDTRDMSLNRALNYAIEQSSGRYLMLSKIGLRYRKDAVELLQQTLQQHSEKLVHANCMIARDPGATFLVNRSSGMIMFDDVNQSDIYEGSDTLGPLVMWEKKLHHIYGLFNEELAYLNLSVFWMRIQSEGEGLIHIPQLLGIYHQPNNKLPESTAMKLSMEHMCMRQKYAPGSRIYLNTLSIAELKERQKKLQYLFSIQHSHQQKVIKSCDEHLFVAPNDIEILYLKSTTLIRMDRVDEAESMMRRILKLNPDHTPTLNNIAIIEWKTGKRSQAVSHLERVLEIDNQNTEAINNLAEMYMTMNKPHEAAEYYKQILHMKGMHVPTLKALSGIYDSVDPVQATYYEDLLDATKGYMRT